MRMGINECSKQVGKSHFSLCSMQAVSVLSTVIHGVKDQVIYFKNSLNTQFFLFQQCLQKIFMSKQL